jgi:hypothetical protein
MSNETCTDLQNSVVLHICIGVRMAPGFKLIKECFSDIKYSNR